MADQDRQRQQRLHSGYSGWWGVLAVLVALLELLAIRRRSPGDTLSEHVWRWVHDWPGVAVLALLTWLSLWHLPWGAGRRLSWLDLVAASVGALVWLAARRWPL